MIDESYDKGQTSHKTSVRALVDSVRQFLMPPDLSYYHGQVNERSICVSARIRACVPCQIGKHQSILNNECSLYFVEAPSTCNEVIVSTISTKNKTDARFKRWVISNMMISRT